MKISELIQFRTELLPHIDCHECMQESDLLAMQHDENYLCYVWFEQMLLNILSG